MTQPPALSTEQKIANYTGVLHTLAHARADLPQRCTEAAKSLDTVIARTSALLTHLIDGELPRGH